MAGPPPSLRSEARQDAERERERLQKIGLQAETSFGPGSPSPNGDRPAIRNDNCERCRAVYQQLNKNAL